MSSRKAKKSKPVDAPRSPALGFVPNECFASARTTDTLPIFIVSVEDYPTWVASAPAEIQAWLRANHFKPKPGACSLLPEPEGCAGVVLTITDPSSPWEYANVIRTLPPGQYEAEPELDSAAASAMCLGWALGSYQFDRYKKAPKTSRATLVWPEEADRDLVLALSEGVCLARDLVNTPALDMGPEELAEVAKALAKMHGAKCTTIVGKVLLEQNYPMIFAVGRASSRPPRLIDLRWGESGPLVTLVGKGVCFDTGGLDLKPPQYMKLMKKDMGGAALVLGLAHAVMSEKLPIRLRVLVPAVENSVSGDAMRPLDVLSTRKGISVEVGDTDAEGRLILGDALWEACQDDPDLVIDAATLTGAARVALGTEVPVIFANDDQTWSDLQAASETSYDPLWRLPLFDAYRRKLDSKVADLCNIAGDAFGGAIIAALFLREFVKSDTDWLHMDTMGYNLEARPGRPAGGEALGLLALFQMLSARFAAVRQNDQTSEKKDASAPTDEPSLRTQKKVKKPKAKPKPRSSKSKKSAKG